MQKPCTYLITNTDHSKFFTGSTQDLARRIFQYKKGNIEGIAKEHKLNKLVWYQRANSMELAKIEAKRIALEPKASKIELIRKMNPQWRDLYRDII